MALKFCVDYQKLNAGTTLTSYSLPQSDKCIDTLGKATIFLTLDANSGYWEIAIDEQDLEKMALPSHQRLYRFVRMPCGLKSVLSTLQQKMNVILSAVKRNTAFVYLADIVILRETVMDHMVYVDEVMSLPDGVSVIFKLRQRTFFAESIS